MNQHLERPGTALLIIDLQKDVLAQCVDTTGVLARTAVLIGRARASQLPVIFVQHEEPDMPRHSSGWELDPSLPVQPGDALVFKSYRDSFEDTTLAAELARLDVGRLIVAGAQSDYCVRTTAHRAAIEGYDLVLVSDCHTTEDTEFGGVPVTGEQIVAHTNQYFSGLDYPGGSYGIATHLAVALA
ncbi:isochorismatase family protein [Arthrobacter glacialis]|uniref:isochorismatase family protein n=1 Tax=Arthrobacter glacialis TaxID=1664 RepID=UPI001FAEDEBB|nr:isochorismatase family protein [Arthrobacter glacialis]